MLPAAYNHHFTTNTWLHVDPSSVATPILVPLCWLRYEAYIKTTIIAYSFKDYGCLNFAGV